jgi:selenide,water dikinase
VTFIDELKIILSMPDELTQEQQQQVADDIISGFRESAKLVKCRLTIERININPWCMIGGIATAICTNDELIMPTGAIDGDVIILTKPLGVQLATNAKIWMEEGADSWTKLSQHMTADDVNETYEMALKSMATLNHTGAVLMQKHGAHCATDVTGFGIAGHAENLLQFQESSVDFVINRMPIIKNVMKMSEVLGRMEKMTSGKMVETSGGLFLCLPSETAKAFCDEFAEMSGECCWIIGRVVEGDRRVVLEDVDIFEV